MHHAHTACRSLATAWGTRPLGWLLAGLTGLGACGSSATSPMDPLPPDNAMPTGGFFLAFAADFVSGGPVAMNQLGRSAALAAISIAPASTLPFSRSPSEG